MQTNDKAAFGDIMTDETPTSNDNGPSASSSYPPRPTTPTSSRYLRSAPPSVSRASRIRRRILQQVNGVERLTYSAPSKLHSLMEPKTFPCVVTGKTGSNVPTLEGIPGSYNPNIPEPYYSQRFEGELVLSIGEYSKMSKVRCKWSGTDFALKSTIRGMSKVELINEIKRHEGLGFGHPNIVKFLAGWEEGNYAYLLMEYHSAGSLDTFLKPRKVILEESVIWSYFIDTLLALGYLHKIRRVHCDVKPANVLLADDNICKLADFGLLYTYKDGESGLVYAPNHDGDGKYMAPEMLHCRLSTAADIYSLGAMLLELACPKVLPPLQSLYCAESDCLPRPEYLEGIPKAIVDLIRSMMSQCWRSRPSAAEILDRPEVRAHMSQRQAEILYECNLRPSAECSAIEDSDEEMLSPLPSLPDTPIVLSSSDLSDD